MSKNKYFKRFSSMHWLHWVIIALSLCLTFVAWYFTQQQVDEKRQAQFDRESFQVIDLVRERMTKYEDALWSAASLIKSNGDEVGFKRWKSYVDSLDLVKKYPGINGLGVIFKVSQNDVGKFVAQQRLMRPGFSIYPQHQYQYYMPITYIIPIKGNEKAVGLDMAHESNRLMAANKAMSSGKAQITGPITLVQDSDRTPGFLFYVPIYSGGPYESEALREKHAVGLVYAPFIVKKLMVGALLREGRHVSIKLSDGKDILYNELLKSNDEYLPDSQYRFEKKVLMYGREWGFTVVGSKSFSKVVVDSQPFLILLFGLTIDALLLFLFLVISGSNKRALNYADAVTKNLVIKNSELTQVKDKLEKMVHFDKLTGLPNRYSFNQYLKRAISRAGREKKIVAVCFLDLDNFKNINDSLGHSVGDKLLQSISGSLRPILRETDFMARLSGDEFGLVVEGITSPVEVGGVVRRYLSAVCKSVLIGKNQFMVSASIGVALYPTGGDSVETLIKHADIAMYKAKSAGRSTFRFFNEETNRQVQRQNNISRSLEGAVERNELFLVYQPQFCIEDNRLIGVEVLMRFKSECFGNVPPSEFIPIAEESAIIHEIGDWLFSQVAKDYPKIQSCMPGLVVSINISMRQFEKNGFATRFLGMLAEKAISAEHVMLEITETAAMRSPDDVINMMNRLTEHRVSFALDDFGVGYSSMGYLKNMPVSHIKIDKRFVDDIDKDASSAAIVEAIVRLSESLGAKTIAEGVEESAQLDILKRVGCDYVQGYYFYKPMLLLPLIEILKKSR